MIYRDEDEIKEIEKVSESNIKIFKNEFYDVYGTLIK